MQKTVLLAFLAMLTWAGQSLAQDAAAKIVKPVGTVKAIMGNTITLTTDAGATMNVTVGDNTRMLRTAPGQKDLKDAVPAHLQDVQVGDRILARGTQAGDGGPVAATAVIVMKARDIAAMQQQERDDWEKRGIGGLVTAIDAARGNITISISALGGSKTEQVHVAKTTIIRRYAPDSIKFDDAKAGTIEQTKVGDQLRARGTNSADGSEMAAEEIVSGTFLNIAGTVISTDAAKQEVSVMDLATKKPLILRIAGDSQLREMPTMMAQRMAMRMKGGSAGEGGVGPMQPGKPAERTGAGGFGGPRPGAGRGDFQQMLARLPVVTLGALQKGSAVMIVATEGSASTPPTAITLLTGVEPILTATPKGGQAAMLLSPWNLSGAGSGDAAGGANP